MAQSLYRPAALPMGRAPPSPTPIPKLGRQVCLDADFGPMALPPPPPPPWTNGQVERMNRTLKDATVNRYTKIPIRT